MYEKNIDRYIPVSMFVREVLERNGIPPQKMSVLHPFTTMPHVARADFPQGFFYFGALESNKGIEVALRAIDLIEGEEFLYVAGDGPLKEKVLAHPRVKYLGVLSPQEVAIQLAHTRAVLMPSLWDEPFGLSALEAMLTHTPLIVSLRGALPELVEGGECGIVTKTGDFEALARAMRFVIDQPESAKAMAARAYEKAHNVANIQNHLQQLFAIYNKALVDKSI
jgi:glycosyltransferase involved in cell wall biosynthesis